MKTFLKIFFGFIIVTLTTLYLAFIFILPNVIDLNKYKPELKQIVKEQGNLNLNIANLKLVTKPNLQIGLETGNTSLMLPDNTTILNFGNANLRISIPQLLLLKIKIIADIQDPSINLEIANGKQFKIVSHIENLLNSNKEEIAEAETTAAETQTLPINPEWIKFFAKININNYKLIVNDTKSNHSLKIVGDNLKLGYFNQKRLKVKTNAKFYSDEENMINANLDINTYLPKITPSDNEEDDAVEVKLPFINPVLVYRDYNLKADIDAKLKLKEKDDIIKSWGYLNINNLTANLSGLQLPESYLKFKSFGSKIETDTNIFFAKNENLKILGKFDYINPNMDLNILSKKIYFNDVIILSKAILDTLRIKNDFASLKGSGYFIANADIKTNFKNLKSNGSFVVNNGKISSNKIGLVLDKMNINIILDNNVLKIPNSSALINGKKLNISGSIDEKTNTNIDINLEKLPLPQLFKVFAPTDIKKTYKLNSGNLTLKAKIKGKLKNAIANLKINLYDFTLSDSINTFIVNNEKADIEFLNNFKTGIIVNKNFKIYIPMSKSLISVPLTSINMDTKNLSIPTSIIKVNDNSKLLFSGNIQNYTKHPDINFVSTGKLTGKDIRKFAGKDFESFIDAKGALPIEFSISGDDKKQTINVMISSDENNYITPVHFNNIAGKNTVLKATVKTRNNHIIFKDSGFFIQAKTKDEEGNDIINYNPIISLSGTIVGDYINKISLDIPSNLNGVLYAFKNSKLQINTSHLNIYGDISAPKYRGKLSFEDIYIPDLYTSLKRGNIDFKDSYLTFNLINLLLNNSDMNISGDLSLIPSKIFTLSNLNINSKNLDADKIMKVSDAAMNIMPQSGNSEAQDIPVLIKNGKINFKKIKSGNIILNNTTSKIALKDNNFFLFDMLTHMCDGKINGKIGMNLLTGFMKIQLKGSDLNTEKLLFEAAALKDALSGTTSFETDISLSGSTYEEQVKSLLGKVSFIIKNGQFGPFGRLENMILAENIRESEFFKSTIGRALEPLVTIDTTHYSTLDGVLTFKDGITNIESINSSGNILALNLFGKFNLLNNIADMKVRSRLASDVSDMLGPISVINPINLVKSTPGLNIVLAKSFALFCETVTPDEMDKIPDFAKKHSDNNATKFQIVIRGNVNKPLTLVKSFKWLATQEDMDKANAYASELQLPEEETTSKSKKKKK